jgi:tRNA(fMet)-specific endonuclease VapC
LPWRSEEAAVYGVLRASLNARGKSLSEMDMLIAAHALSVNATLVTGDKAFRLVESLRGLDDWTTDIQ